MADQKISALTGATTPLAGTEVLPIVQSSSTVKVAVSNLTAGRTVAALGYTATGDSGFGTTTPLYRNHTVLESATTNAPISPVGVTALTTGTAANGFGIQFENLAEASDGSAYAQTLVTSIWTNATAANRSSKYSIWTRNNGGALTEQFAVGSTGDLTALTGNLVIGTSGKGIDFSATAGTGTSELLADYEEGDWTPTLSSATGAITTVGAATGSYTKVGRLVTLNANVVITTNGTGATALLFGNLPYSISTTNTTASGIESAVSGKSLAISAYNSTTLYVTFYDFTYPGANNARIVVSVTYPT